MLVLKTKQIGLVYDVRLFLFAQVKSPVIPQLNIVQYDLSQYT